MYAQLGCRAVAVPLARRCVAWRGVQCAPSSLPTRVDAAPLRPCAAKKQSACMLKVMPIMLMVSSGRGSSPLSMTMICRQAGVHAGRRQGGGGDIG